MAGSSRIYSDQEKLALWDIVCIGNNWSHAGELERWLEGHGVRFTVSGSAVPMSPFRNEVKTVEDAKKMVGKMNGEALATAIMQTICGLLVFMTTDAEKAFWSTAKERLWKAFHSDLPVQVVPLMYRDELFGDKSEV
jgi:hypothetical protein